MRKLIVLSSVIFLSASAWGCAQKTMDKTAPQGEWRLLSIAGNTPLSLKDSDQPFTLTMTPKGEAYGQVACNRWKGQVAEQDGKLVFGTLSSTRMKCPIDDPAVRALEGRYLAELGKSPSFESSDGRLTLRFADGSAWTFKRTE